MIRFGNPYQKMDALEAQAELAFDGLNKQLYHQTLLAIIDHSMKHRQLPLRHLGVAIRKLAELVANDSLDFATAHQMLSEAREILSVDPGPGSLEWLEAEAAAISLKFIEVSLYRSGNPVGQRPVFWDGTSQGAQFSLAELGVMRDFVLPLKICHYG